MYEVKLRLPWPPSVDHYWRNVGNRMLLSANARKYKLSVSTIVQGARERGEVGSPMEGRLSAVLSYSAPSRRGWDIDCYFKAPLDAMEGAGVYENDRQIRGIQAIELPYGDSCVYVRLWELD